MMKTTYVLTVILALFLSPFVIAQVGIGTTTPNSLLEIPASNSTAPAATDGLLIPRINSFPSTNPGADQDGMLVFLTSSSGSYNKGFHYWDNIAGTWIAYNDEWKDGTGGNGDQLIYANQADANGIRVAVLDNGRIGMGTDTPEESLELKLEGDNDIQISSASAPDTPQLIFYTTKGTFDTPDFLSDNDEIGYVTGKVWTGSGKSGDAANIQMKADGDHSAGNLPTKIEFNTVAAGQTDVNGTGVEMIIKNTGNVGIGEINPTASLHIQAGTASAGTAPIKFTAGTNLASPEAGALEYDGTNLYFTPSTQRRRVVTGLRAISNLDFPNLSGGGTAARSVTVTGAVSGNACNCSPQGVIETGLQWNCYVSAANTVIVLVSNISNSNIDPAAVNWIVTVID